MNDKTAKLPDDMSVEELHEHYSEMLATANDLGFRVPDELLVESDDAEILRGVCAKLDDGITAFRAGLDVGDDKSDEGMPAPEKPKVTRVGGKKPTAKKTTKKSATKPTDSSSRPSAGTKKPVAKGAKPVVKAESTESTAKPKDSPEAPSKLSKSEESTMAKTAKKTAKKAAPAKKTAEKAAPAKKTAKKADAAKAAKPKKSSFPEKAKIHVLIKENPCRKGSPRAKRVDNIMAHHNKSVSSFVESGGKEASLRYSIDRGWIKVA